MATSGRTALEGRVSRIRACVLTHCTAWRPQNREPDPTMLAISGRQPCAVSKEETPPQTGLSTKAIHNHTKRNQKEGWAQAGHTPGTSDAIKDVGSFQL